MNTVLIVDDMKAFRDQFSYDLHRKTGYEVFTARDGKDALRVLHDEDIDVAIIDLEMPGMDGLQLLEEIKKNGFTDIPVIVYTAAGNFERCVRAVKSGAYNFFDKGEVSIEQLSRFIDNAIEHRRLTRENKELRAESGLDTDMIGVSSSMANVRQQIEKIAQVPSNVLIQGESGTGKELVAKAIHKRSPRAGKSFVALNCAALPENLVESELFGFERGAFTGAVRSTRGKFQIADGGTLFLDEIGDMPLSVQAKLLRVLEEGTMYRLGGEEKVITVDVRVITATHKNLQSEVEAHRFRKDLYFRICTHILTVPPLRDRKEDIKPLAMHFVDQTCKRFGIPVKKINGETIALLRTYDWKMNNVRELENIIERMIIQCSGGEILPEHVPIEIRDGDTQPSAIRGKNFQDLKQEAEKRILTDSLIENDWHITKTAKMLGISNHSNLLKMMRRLDIKKP
jgi:DNA-binding NtrC family response regulator